MNLFLHFIYKRLIGILLIHLIAFASITTAFSQVAVGSYLEIGNNAVSQGIYSDCSAQVSFKYHSFSLFGGSLLRFSNFNPQILNALTLSAAHRFVVAKQPLNFKFFYLWKPFSEFIHETNFGCVADYEINHFGGALGISNRTYSLSNLYISTNDISNDFRTISEPLNLMYRFTYYHTLTPMLDIEASVTNFNTFIIQQETNPMIRTKLTYNYKPNLQFYAEMEYMQAGLLNIRVNYFGLLMRGGLIWSL